MAHVLGYARVSTADQTADSQVDELRAAGAERVFIDKASGKLDGRPQLHEVLDRLLQGDTLMVWRLDRLGRSLRHLIDTVNDLADRRVGFRSLTESIDTTTPAGRLVFHLFASLAEFEASLVRERTMSGLAAARARGRNGGRPRSLTPDKLAVAQQLYDSRTKTIQQIADVVGVGRTTLYRHLQRT
jgi:DNA invertase Pin-like site-specific DNA recombinase